MDRISNTVIQNIRDLLVIEKKSQSELAQILNVPRQTVSRILKGNRSISCDELKKIADFLCADADDLYFDFSNFHLEKDCILFHGSANKRFIPEYGKGGNQHDYGNGFYLSTDEELAKEWAVCSGRSDGYLHKYRLNTGNLRILYLNEKYDVLAWLSVLAKHRVADSSKRYQLNSKMLMEKFYDKNIENYDVIVGYRADDSYFGFAKHAIKNEVNISLLEEIMKMGKLGYQVFIQSKKAFDSLEEIEQNEEGYFEKVDRDQYFRKYNVRDMDARDKVAKLLNSERNTLEDTIEKYLR